MTAVRARTRVRSGLPLALVSAASFALAGPLAASLLVTGWSPAAVVAVRVGGAFLALLGPSLLLLRRVGWPSGPAAWRMVAYGVVAVAGAQLCFFSAVRHLSVGVALLIEYTAPVLLIGWHWWRTGLRPRAATLLGAALALGGLALVLDLTGDVRISLVGVAWALGAALGLCVYFVLAESGGEDAPPPLLLTSVGTGVGAVVLLAASGLGLLELSGSTAPASLAGHPLPWWLPLLALVCISAVLAYLTGIAAVRRLGSSISSFVALTEVLFAAAFAALLIGQHPSTPQLIGGVLVLVGIAVVQRGSR